MIDACINGNHFDRGNSVVQELRCMFKPVEREQLDQPMQNQPSKGYDKAYDKKEHFSGAEAPATIVHLAACI